MEAYNACPSCGDTVDVDKDDPVWTCPADLAEDNPYREPCLDAERLERERHWYFGNCLDDVGGRCYERLPLHGVCYERGDY